MEKEFTEGDAFVAAYSEYFGVVYKEALKYSGNHHIAKRLLRMPFSPHIYSLEVNQNSRLEHGYLCSQGTER